MDTLKKILGLTRRGNGQKRQEALTKVSKATSKRMSIIMKEFSGAFKLLHGHDQSVTFFGSTRFSEDNPYYIKARRLGQRIARELRYTVITGGGSGIMEAANRGAYEAGGKSIGMNITLPHEQQLNRYVTAHMSFYHFFTRKVALGFLAETYVIFPGGFGTLDEFFEIITLIQTEKIPRVPVVLVGREFWEKIDAYFKAELLEKHETISPEDLSIYTITDNEDEIIDIIRKAPLRREP